MRVFFKRRIRSNDYTKIALKEVLIRKEDTSLIQHTERHNILN
jgi:hypothetical protein